MKVVVETPKWSFRKRIEEGKEYRKVFSSPVPTPFNYGFIGGTTARDGMPLDVIVLGETLEAGSVLDVTVIGRVLFLDDGVDDDKYIASLDGERHQLRIWLFFTVYAFAKFLIGLFSGKWTRNRFAGVEWFERELTDKEELSAILSS